MGTSPVGSPIAVGSVEPGALPQSGGVNPFEQPEAPREPDHQTRLQRLLSEIHTAARLLPAQGPITSFTFLNPLQAFEHRPFDAALIDGARLFGNQPYWPEERYRAELQQGRLTLNEVAATVEADLGPRASERVTPQTTRLVLQVALLQLPLPQGSSEQIHWLMGETEALVHFQPEVEPEVRRRLVERTQHWLQRVAAQRDAAPPQAEHAGSTADPSEALRFLQDVLQRYDLRRMGSWNAQTWESITLTALWRACRRGLHFCHWAQRAPSTYGVRHRDWLRVATGVDSDELVHEVLIPFCAAYADQGLAAWTLPGRERGFWAAFCESIRHRWSAGRAWLQPLAHHLEQVVARGQTSLESIDESLAALGVRDSERSDYLAASLVALKGWAGTIYQMEVRDDRVPRGAPSGTLVDYLAARLLLEQFALQSVARSTLEFDEPLCFLRTSIIARLGRRPATFSEPLAFTMFQLAQVLAWSPDELQHWSAAQWQAIVSEVQAFGSVPRRRILHLTMERHFRRQALDALVAMPVPQPRTERPAFQLACCIDTRSESFRRHIEEVCPAAETFGIAGFYGVPMYFRGIADANFTALCPIVIRPEHWVTEEPVYTLARIDEQRRKTRHALGTVQHTFHRGSRNLIAGALLTAGGGVLATVPLVARVLFPRWTSKFVERAGSLVEPPQITRLRLERQSDPPGPEGDQVGFTLSEMTQLAEKALRDLGLTKNFARLVFFLGHGSACLNNPHKSAYDCGACSGNSGGPNSRALAWMLNDHRVRKGLFARGIDVPDDTFFLGGQHNTATDRVTFFDLDLLPLNHRAEFEQTNQVLIEVCQRNAHERCRRFTSAPLDASLLFAKRHVEERAEDLAQPRPEFGNATNALAVVGRRSRTLGLMLDRRSFLISYDPTQDDASYSILGRILGAVVPVCSGINLQYFFSAIDNTGWGSGNKLPHNIVSLQGVMDGHASDLRTGLPWQGVEIHEPLRLLFAIETIPDAIEKILARNQTVRQIIEHGWVQLALLSPVDSTVLEYRNGAFVPYVPEQATLPTATSSQAWYGGRRGFLEFARITPEVAGNLAGNTAQVQP